MMKNILLFFLFFYPFINNGQVKTVVYFNSGKSDLNNVAQHKLDSLILKLKLKGNYSIEIAGYTDNIGDEKSNDLLSSQRANSVAGYLKKKAIPEKDITIKGFGENDPLASNDEESGRAKNRRVEILMKFATQQPQKGTENNQPAPFPQLPPKVTMHQAEALTENSSVTDLDVGQVLRLENLNFIGGTDLILPESKPALENLLKIMKTNSSLEIEIGGHVCCADDMPLSIKRAEAVAKFLTDNGINARRIIAKGYSRNKPIEPDDREEKNAKLNRRVEITILKK